MATNTQLLDVYCLYCMTQVCFVILVFVPNCFFFVSVWLWNNWRSRLMTKYKILAENSTSMYCTFSVVNVYIYISICKRQSIKLLIQYWLRLLEFVVSVSLFFCVCLIIFLNFLSKKIQFELRIRVDLIVLSSLF